MNTRQARNATILRVKQLTTLLTFFVLVSACAPVTPFTPPTQTSLPVTATAAPLQTLTPSPVPTSTPLACLSQPGRVEKGVLTSTKPAQEYFIYLPPCYSQQTNVRYPVLYLLHGQTYKDDQWIRIGAIDAINNLILSGKSTPFIIVFPDDRYWYSKDSGDTFGARLVDTLIPYIDKTYRTLPDRKQRAIGGLSRGAGWALRLGLTRWELFGHIGLHSLAVLETDGNDLEDWLDAIPAAKYPHIYMDIGESDAELGRAKLTKEILANYNIPVELHISPGFHEEEYWSAHLQEYLQWDAEGWKSP